MSDFTKNEEENYQKEMRSMIEDLVSTLSASNNGWNSWELEFIENLEDKLDSPRIFLSKKQEVTMFELWDRI